MKDIYYKIILINEKLHRNFLEIIKIELHSNRIFDINNVQSLLLYNINDKEINVGELTKYGYYSGTNASYNLRKLVENGYICRQPVMGDRRVSELSLTNKGKDLWPKLDELFRLQAENLVEEGISESDLKNIQNTLEKIENLLSNKIR